MVRSTCVWRWCAWLVLLAGLAVLAGCVSVPDADGRESELPWSEPKPWEGVIPMPGFDNR